MNVDGLFKYPLISAISNKKNEFQGYMRINKKDVEVAVRRFKDTYKVKLPQNGSYELEVKTALNKLKRPSILECLDCVQTTLSSKFTTQTVFKRTDICRLVLHEFSEVCNIYTNLDCCEISADLSEITLIASDSGNRKHKIVVGIDYSKSDSDIFQIKSHQFPNNWFVQSGTSLKTICEKFHYAIRALQKFWDVLDEFDSNFWILDPEQPQRNDVHRRIALGENLSVIVTFDPLNVNNLPDLKFFGAERHLQKYRERLVENLTKWDRNNDTLTEFLKLLGVESLPKKPHGQHDTDLFYNPGECCICFCSKLDNRLPEIVCPNSSCEECFHIQCLYQYLISLNSRKCFNEIRGNCPNCEKAISCPIP